jgi:hypothetical protein
MTLVTLAIPLPDAGRGHAFFVRKDVADPDTNPKPQDPEGTDPQRAIVT